MAVDHDELISVAEAAKALKVSVATIKRWLKDGRIPGYHLGPRYIRIRRSDLDQALTPVRAEVSPIEERTGTEPTPISTSLTVKPLTDQQLGQMDQAIQRSQEVIDMIRTRRKSQPLAPSWPILREIREERAKRDE